MAEGRDKGKMKHIEPKGPKINGLKIRKLISSCFI